jgi:4-amino-4-deoxy-L-arabinose transferase-like glycosyltransferase
MEPLAQPVKPARTWKPWAVLALVLVAAALFRVVRIEADPPTVLPRLSGSAGIYFDEGIYSHNARNKILFGRWVLDEWNPLVYNAPLTLIYYLGFRLCGISIVTVKATNILFGLLGILLFFAGVRRYLKPGQALALTMVFGFDFYWLMYNRLGLLENFSALCFLLCFFLFGFPVKKFWPAFGLGLTAAVAALSKYLFSYFLVAALLAVAYRAWRHSSAKYFFAFLAGCLAAGLPWFFGIFLPFRSTFSKIGAGWGVLALPRSVGQAFANLLHNPLPRYLQLLPVAGLLLVLFTAWALLKALRGRAANRPNSADVFVFLWIVGAVFSIGLLNYRPLRYYLPLLPAIYLAFSLLLRDRDWLRSENRWFWPLTGAAAVLFLPFFRDLYAAHSPFLVFPLWLRVAVFFSLAGIVFFFSASRSHWRAAGATTAFIVMLACSLFLYVDQFYRRPSFRLQAAARYMETLPPGSVVMGQEAPRLTLGTDFKAVLAYENWFNDRDPFRKYRPNYVLVLDRFNDAELGWMRRRFPEAVARFKRMRRFPVWDTTVSLYRVMD